MTGSIPEGKSSVSLAPLITLVVAMFADAFLYEMVVPLTPMSKVGMIDDRHVELLYGAYAFSVLFFTPLWSWLAERLGYKRALIIGAIAQGISAMLFAWAWSFDMLLLARIVEGASAASTWTAGLALIAETYPTQRVQKMGLVMSGSTIGSVFGPLVGGLLYDWGGYLAPFYLAFVLLLGDFILRIALLQHLARRPVGKSVLGVLIRNRAVLAASVVVAVVAASWAGIVEPLIPSYLEHHFHATPAAVGFIFTASCIAYALVTSLVDRMAEKKGLGLTIAFGVAVMATGLPLLVIGPGLVWVGIVLSLMSIGFAFALNPTLAALGDAVDRCGLQAYAAVYAIFNIAYSVGTIVGASANDALMNYLSLLESLVVLGLVLFAVLPLIIWGLKEKPVAA